MDKPVFPDYPPTLPNAIADCSARYGERPFLAGEGLRLNYREADRQSAALAKGLLAAGIGKGGRVAILMPNCVEWVLCWFAAGRIGAFTVPVSTLFQAPELSWLLKHADIATLLVMRRYAGHDYLERVQRALPELARQASTRLVLSSHPYLRRIVVWSAADGPRDEALPQWALRGPDDLLDGAKRWPAIDDAFLKSVENAVVPADALIGICTSGTTAEPKLVVHTHASTIRTTHMYRAYRGIGAQDRDLSSMPLFWTGGLNTNLMPDLYEGACLVFPPSPRLEDLLATLSKERITRLRVSMGLQAALLDRARAGGVDLSGIAGVAEPVDERGNIVPVRLRSGPLLGMTETFGPHGVQPPGAILPEERIGSSGQAIEGIERRIVDPVSGTVQAVGTPGELQVRGFSMMEGYYKRERAEVFAPDGWFPTGDLCRIDAAGYIYFEGRRSDMIKTAGANVAPLEVEAALRQLQGVNEAIVFGVEDAMRGEAVVAVVVPHAGRTVDPETLRAELRDRISSYKVPAEVFVLSDADIPRSGTGKARKNVLKERLGELRRGRGDH